MSFSFEQLHSGGETPSTPQGFQDEMHQYRLTRVSQTGYTDTGTNRAPTNGEPVLLAMNSGGAGPTSDAGKYVSYMGYITYAGLAASAFGSDDPLQLQTKATRFFQEKLLHHHAIDNPPVWQAIGDIFMTEEHMASSGAAVKPIKLKTLQNEAKHESKNGGVEQDATEANKIIQDISAGLRSPSDYVLAAKFAYMEAVNKADLRASQETQGHKDEKRLVGRLKLLSGETDRAQAAQTTANSIAPIENELGQRVSLRLDTAAFLDRYGRNVPELGWSTLAAQLRQQAQSLYDDPTAISEPVRRQLHQRYPDQLKDVPPN
jgi:hypothetical protein